MNRIARISLSALALLAAFTLGMIFAQRMLTPARAEGDNPVVSVIPVRTISAQNGNNTITNVTQVLVIYANGRTEKQNN